MLRAGPEGTPALLLAHGAGAPMDSAFMDDISGLLAERGAQTLRFEFPYMATRRAEGSKRPPDRMQKLEAAFREAFAEVRTLFGATPLYVGGKSMGGRVASHLVDDLGAAGLVCLGYPFHPPGRPEKLRTEHLAAIQAPTLIVQGERDPFGKRDEVAAYALSPSTKMFWAPDGDHDQKPRKSSGFTHAENMAAVADAVASFMGAA